MQHKITPFLWFVDQAEEAARFYCSVFKRSKMGDVTPYPVGTPGKPGSVMTVEFELEGLPFTALNGGEYPEFKGPGPVSFVVETEDQAETDYYWERLLEGGGKEQQCGWLVDRFGTVWQVVPRRLTELTKSSDPSVANRVTAAMMKMVKIDIAALEKAAAGE